MFELEQRTLFASTWQVAGPERRVANAGERIVTQVGRVPIVVVRDDAGRLNAFVNVCRHRGYPVASDERRQMTLQCGYHGWTYGLDGRLRRAPRCEREEEFDASQIALPAVAVDVWNGLVWVNPDPTAKPLLESHPELRRIAETRDATLAPYDYLRTASNTVPVNWKAWVDNAQECYHCPTIHPTSFGATWDIAADRYEFVTDGALIAQFGDPRPSAARGDDHGRYRDLYLFPSSFLVADGILGIAGALIPTSPDSCEIVSHVFVKRTVDRALLAERLDVYERTREEDAAAVLLQQRGLRSGALDELHILPAAEPGLAHFHALLAARLDGPDQLR